MDIERAVDRALPYVIVALVPLIVLGFVVPDGSAFAIVLNVLDWVVISIFGLDLFFKARRAASWDGFLKRYWIDVIALLPVFAVLRIFEEIALILDAGAAVQEVGSEALSLQRESSRVSRMHLFRWARPLARSPRLLRASTFFRAPRAS